MSGNFEEFEVSRGGENIMYIVKGLDSKPLDISRSLCFTYLASVLVLVEKWRGFRSTSLTICGKAATAQV